MSPYLSPLHGVKGDGLVLGGANRGGFILFSGVFLAGDSEPALYIDVRLRQMHCLLARYRPPGKHQKLI